MAAQRTWLVKTEPESYSIDDLARDRRTCWDGVRNYQARNFMRDGMRVGDLVLVHHSGSDPAGIVGLARVCREAYPDASALDRRSKYFDPKATADSPIWMMVDLEFVEKLPRMVTLDEMKGDAALRGMPLLQRGQRLSVMPIDPAHVDHIRRLGRRPQRRGGG